MSPIPPKCPKGADPYTSCPLMFRHEDEFILATMSLFAQEVIRVSGDEMRIDQITDEYTSIITAYQNGRIHALLFDRGNDGTERKAD